MTLHLDGVHICHILKYRLRRLYHFQPKNEMKVLVKMVYLEGICMVKADRHVVREQCNEETPKGPAFCALEVSTKDCCQLEIRGE